MGRVGGIHAELIRAASTRKGMSIPPTSKSATPDWAGNPLTHYERFKESRQRLPPPRSPSIPEGAGWRDVVRCCTRRACAPLLRHPLR